jgi:hypothetical protein
MNLTEEKMKLVGIYNALQEKIDAYWLEDIAIDSKPFRKLCADKQAVEMKIKDLNKLLNIKDK